MAVQLPPQVAPPEFELLSAIPAKAALIALPVWAESGDLMVGPGAADIDDEYDLLGLLDAEGATGAAGEIVSLTIPGRTPRRVLLVGVGDQTPDHFRRAGAALGRAVRDRSAVVTTIPALCPSVALEPFVAGLTLASFNFSWRAQGPQWTPVGTVRLADMAGVDAELRVAVALARASWRARFGSTVPSNVKNPEWLAEQARTIPGLTVQVWDEKALAKDGFGGILAVGSGSVTPPRLIRLDYKVPGADKKTPTIVLVGKGITFDTGGLNIKPGDAMKTMKRDATGGAVVLAVMGALADIGCPVNVIGLVAAAENAVSGSSMRPGDVLRHYGGRTTEVTNTDAEGRLVLADAMAYAVDKLKPATIVDIATLTGAIKVALGQQLGGLFATSDELARAFLAAGEASGEPLWRMPLAEVYNDKLASPIADADNAPGGAGAITAALFLKPFVRDVPWVHLDIASVGDAAADAWEWTSGPTGFGARLLLEWLRNLD
jgi:leucyl aminopeptidase